VHRSQHDRGEMAADFSQPVPVNADKVDALHRQGEMPARPKLGRSDLLKLYLPPALGLMFAVGAVAMAFQARASWESHRDWVVPVTVPFLVIGGLGMGYLAARMNLRTLAPTVALLSMTLVFGFLNVMRGQWVDGEDGLRDVLSVITGVLLGATIVSAIATYAWDEIKNPVRQQ
jgi:peptidoglycan/LPS O-acetylase OafA/YrhL